MKDKKSADYKWKKFLKVFGTSTLAVVMALSLTGCGTTTVATPKQLIVWGLVDEDVFKPIIKDFTKKNKGIAVKYYKKTLDSSYEDNALNSILSGQGPDVWAIPSDWVSRHKDKLAPAPDALLTSNKLKPVDYFAANIISDSVFDNHLYALTPSTDVLHIYYNPRLFSQALERVGKALKNNPEERKRITGIISQFPVTWQDFDSIIPWLTVKSGNNIQIAGAALGTSNNVSHPQDILSLLMLQNQTKIVSADSTQATFNLPVKNTAGSDVYSGKNSLEFYNKYADPSNPSYTWNASMPKDVDAFTQEKVAMIFSYTDLTNYTAQLYPNFTYQRALMPQISELNSIVVDYSKYTSYVVPSNSVATDLAWNFVIQLATAESGGYCSATKELSSKKPSDTSTPLLKNRSAGSKPSQSIIQSLVTWNKGRYPTEIDEEFKQAISRLNSRAQGSQAALDTAATNVTSILRKQTW